MLDLYWKVTWDTEDCYVQSRYFYKEKMLLKDLYQFSENWVVLNFKSKVQEHKINVLYN
jgi:hypothetical protein